MPKPFDPVTYWNDLSGSKMSLGEVGWPNWTEAYNAYRYRLSLEQITAKLDELKAKPQAIIEVGCGVGFWSRFLLEKYPDASYLGIDISKQAIQKLSERYSKEPRAEFINSDASEVRPRAGKLDLAICLEVLLHIVDDVRWKKTLSLIGTSLRSGGLALISDPISVYSAPPPFSDSAVKIHSLDEWKAELETNGLEILEIHPRTFFLDNNFDFKTQTGDRWWKSFFQRFNRLLCVQDERLGTVLGYMAYRFDKLYASQAKMGHSCKMLVLRKR